MTELCAFSAPSGGKQSRTQAEADLKAQKELLQAALDELEKLKPVCVDSGMCSRFGAFLCCPRSSAAGVCGFHPWFHGVSLKGQPKCPELTERKNTP